MNYLRYNKSGSYFMVLTHLMIGRQTIIEYSSVQKYGYIWHIIWE